MPAFPGAVGFAASITGGTTMDPQGRHTGGTVCHVTNLNDSGPGSFRDAVSQKGRIVVFDVGGWVYLKTNLSIASNITIAGQTAPGDGIGFIGHGVSASRSTNVVIRHIRIRVGNIGPAYDIHLNGLDLYQSSNILVDHVSVAFAPWNNIDSVQSTNVTLQYVLMTDPIFQKFNNHFETGPATYFSNLWCNAHGRQPLARGSAQYVNNVVYNYGYAFAAHSAPPNSGWDIINNYFIGGPITKSDRDTYFQVASNCGAYATGNLLDSKKDGTLSGVDYNTVGAAKPLSSAFFDSTASLPTLKTPDAFIQTVSSAGAFPRDPVDRQTIDDVRSLGKKGADYSSQATTGLSNNGYGDLNGGSVPLDTDQDGMPDDWKTAKGLDLNNPAVGGQTAASGYTNLEDYLNWKAQPNAYIPQNTPDHPSSTDFDLSPYAAGFIDTPTCTVSNVTGGAVTQSGPGGSLVHFVPAQNTSGIDGFTYSITNGGYTLTGTAGILVGKSGLAKPPATN